jgi:hypothetical protein
MGFGKICILLISLILLQSCIGAPSNVRKTGLTQSSTTTNKTANSPTFLADENLYWFSSSKITGSLTVNQNSSNVFYLRGQFIHNFLSSTDPSGISYFSKQFCLVTDFNSSSHAELRVRAVPMSTTNISTNVTEKMLRVDFSAKNDNIGTQISSSPIYYTGCYKTISGSLTTESAASYALSDICLNCTGSAISKLIGLYENKVALNSMTFIPATSLNMSTVGLKVDLTSSSTQNTSSCSNSGCSAKGFDCCVDGQCVKDGAQKTSASTSSDFTQAMAEYSSNPKTFINWPNIFYICTNIVHQTINTTSSSSAVLVADLKTATDRVAAYTQKWKCLDEYTTSTTYNNCITYSSGTTESATSRSSAAYSSIKLSLAKACGCIASDAEVDLKCPNWGILPIYKTANDKTSSILDFYCYTPSPTNPIGSITNLNLSVSARTSPHRFYSTNGTNYDDLSAISSSSITQEGDDFYYLDQLNKAGPVNGSYNMNSILGRMSVDLSKTSPAKMINVELGRTYVISAINGYYTPCPLCARDSWFQSFFAKPNSQNGTGLQFSGYSTERDAFLNNDTLGNYEDTHFGRACFLPPTMIPFSHFKNADLQTQRLNRLKTQAAFYINGYQRDWYGFNQGALIGSFDGVTWFAIGQGRRITAKSSKLFLAFNGSFFDLAAKTDTVVNIIPDVSSNSAPNVDYDPELGLKDIGQGSAATCQKFHQCETDSDCITQLGWEYSCADISQLKTTWPIFDSAGNEMANQEQGYNSNLVDILSGLISTKTTKRCTYRGAGAPCKQDISTLDSTSQKILTCAPNFYCASISNNKFNDEVVRSPNEPDNFLYGMDAEVLGRPKNYVTGNKTLPDEVKLNIQHATNNASDFGICRPGKSILAAYKAPWNLTALKTNDTNKRTDFISQIGGCNSQAIGVARALGCPVLGNDLNYISYNTDPTDFNINQNMCGGSAKHSTTSVSAFKSIESLAIGTISSTSSPTLALDACLRKAGSPCHTNLDCGPNVMHENIAGTLDINYFGGTEAERSYWSESLICGQGEATPLKSVNISNYLNYDLTQNRCCRDIGKDFTMYTSGLKSIIPDQTGTGNTSLDTSQFTFKDPKAKNRYSRYEVSEAAIHTPFVPMVINGTVPDEMQWRTIHQTGSKTCCGGGWIRKFADGTHTWPIKNRLAFDASNFSCLNYRSPLYDTSFPNATPALFYSDPGTATNNKYINISAFQKEYELFCKNPGEGGCLQISYPDSDNFKITAPSSYTHTNLLDTSPTSDPLAGTTWSQANSVDAPYQPVPYYYSGGKDTDSNGIAYNFFSSPGYDYGVTFYLPAYIGFDGTTTVADSTFIKKVSVKYFYDPPLSPKTIDITADLATSTDCTNAADNTTNTLQPVDLLNNPGILTEKWCITTSKRSGGRPLFIARANTTATDWKYAGIQIEFKSIEEQMGTAVTTPGNPLYYLSKLAKLELLGIPQIIYEPLYCNSNADKLVPGILNSTYTSRGSIAAFSKNNKYSFNTMYDEDGTDSDDESKYSSYGNYDRQYTYQDKIDHAAVFSSKDFTCCTPLGKTPKNGTANCCSGKLGTKNGISQCILPSGTDLHVYFNKFVSSEGVGSGKPGGGLIDDFYDSDGNKSETLTGTALTEASNNIDFNIYTGEPKYRESTNQKLFALGVAYCENGKVTAGGAFGSFPMEPYSGYLSTETFTYITSIVDSILDVDNTDSNNPAGKTVFDQGYRWNHHYYCK